MTRLVRQLSKLHGDPGSIHVVYSGPTFCTTGAKGYVCDVIAPKMPSALATSRPTGAMRRPSNRAVS
ncbi:MAG: hypothetical protein R3E68_07275 [Burkholderiaceae bacterium]